MPENLGGIERSRGAILFVKGGVGAGGASQLSADKFNDVGGRGHFGYWTGPQSEVVPRWNTAADSLIQPRQAFLDPRPVGIPEPPDGGPVRQKAGAQGPDGRIVLTGSFNILGAANAGGVTVGQKSKQLPWVRLGARGADRQGPLHDKDLRRIHGQPCQRFFTNALAEVVGPIVNPLFLAEHFREHTQTRIPPHGQHRR
jgi:hypothetical protein